MLLYASHRIQEARARETNVSNMLCNNHKKKEMCKDYHLHNVEII